MNSPDRSSSSVIGFDGSRLTARFRTGTETYSFELLRRMAKLAEEGELRVYLNAGSLPDELPAGPDYRLLPARRLWTHARLAVEVSRDPPGLLFVPAHVIPVRHPRSVVTIHDIGYRSAPGAFSPRERVELDAATRWNLREAAHVIAVSRQTRADLARHYGMPESRVTPIHHGIDSRFRPPNEDEVFRVRQRYRLERPYVLSVGTLHRRKNVDALIQSFSVVRATRDEVDLVIAGAPGPDVQRLRTQIRETTLADDIHLLDYVPAEDLPAIYGGAELFILLSWHEGFGMPALEAMACGTPVLASSTGALPEVCGSAARFVSPDDAAAVAREMSLLLESEQERARMKEIGLAWSRRFSWDRTARTTLNLLRAVRDGAPMSEDRLAWSDAVYTFQEQGEERRG